MIDLHCHILHGVDDGAADLEEAVRMADLAARDGIHTIVATPHLTHSSAEAVLRIAEVVRELNATLAAKSVPVTIVAGAENFSLHVGNHPPATIGKTSYTLVEFPLGYMPASTWDDLSMLTGQGFRPIIAHPERNVAILNNPDLLFDLLGDDITVQLTAGSLTGEFGPSVRECAFYLLQQDIVDFIASDAHSAIQRIPLLSNAVGKAARIVGWDRANAMVTRNPQCVLDDKPLER